MGKVKTGFFTAVVGDKPIYEGYFLNGKPFVIKAHRYGEVWYAGLLSEEEYQNHLMDNPFEYAYRTYGDRYVFHMWEFSRRVITKANREFGEENVRIIFRELPEEHVRLLLGLTEDEDTTSEGGANVGLFGILNSGRVWVGEEARAICKGIRSKDSDFLKVFVYPHYLVIVGSVGSEEIVVFTSQLEGIDLLREWRYAEGDGEDPDRFNLEAFASLGVPFARIQPRGDGTVSFRIYRRIESVIKAEVDVPMNLDQVSRVVKEYWSWVRLVEAESQSYRPQHVTLPAWRKMIMAYLDEYPNPEDFVRILTVETGVPIEIPKTSEIQSGSQGFENSEPKRIFTTLE